MHTPSGDPQLPRAYVCKTANQLLVCGMYVCMCGTRPPKPKQPEQNLLTIPTKRNTKHTVERVLRDARSGGCMRVQVPTRQDQGKVHANVCMHHAHLENLRECVLVLLQSVQEIRVLLPPVAVTYRNTQVITPTSMVRSGCQMWYSLHVTPRSSRVGSCVYLRISECAQDTLGLRRGEGKRLERRSLLLNFYSMNACQQAKLAETKA